MQDDRLRRVPVAVLVLVGLAIVVWSGAAIYEELSPEQDQYSYDGSESEEFDGRFYEFEELSPGAQNLTTTALRDEIPTRSPVPPEFVTDGSSEDASESPDEMGPVVDYYVRYQGEFHLLGVSTNESAVTVVEISSGPERDLYTYSELSDRERTALDRAIGSDSTVHGPNVSELPHFGAEAMDGRGQYVVYKDGKPYELSVEPDRAGLRLNLLVFVPAFLLGVFAVAIGAAGYWLSSTAIPTAVLLGYVTLFGPPLLTKLGVLAAMEEPQYLLAAAPLVTAVTTFAFGIHRSLSHSTG